MSEIKKRQCADPEYIKKLSESHKGISPPNKGVPMSEEQKRKLSIAKTGCKGHGQRRVLCVETGMIYESLTIASKETGSNLSKIVEVCKHNRRTTNGLHWEYVRVQT